MLEGSEDRVQIRAYGEMVDVLWKQGKADAAIRLEMLWNMLAQRYGFALLCGYSMGNFHKDTKGFEAICREHTHVIAREPNFLLRSLCALSRRPPAAGGVWTRPSSEELERGRAHLRDRPLHRGDARSVCHINRERKPSADSAVWPAA